MGNQRFVSRVCNYVLILLYVFFTHMYVRIHINNLCFNKWVQAVSEVLLGPRLFPTI